MPRVLTRGLNCLLLILGLQWSSASAAVVFEYDETIDGELSGDNLDPTFLNFDVGENLVSGTIAQAEAGPFANTDVFRFVVPDAAQLESIILEAYESDDDVAFIGISEGVTFPYDAFQLLAVAAGDLPISALLGGSTFGPGNVGTDLFARIGNLNGATGFDQPLGPGDYTVYLQQVSDTTDYTFNFAITAIPEPSTLAGLLATATMLGLTRRRRLVSTEPDARLS